MDSIDEILPQVDTITFDCYGTLIDWAAGLSDALHLIFGNAMDDHADELFDAYVEAEAAVEAAEYRSYREVLSETVARLAQRFKIALPPGRAGLVAESLPSWTPFPDTNAALARLKERYRLGVLSNVDQDLFTETARHFDVGFGFVITAEEVESYKPAQGQFRELLERHASRNRVIHVAQSLFHDGGPASELGIAFVWINRYKQTNETAVRPVATYPDLESLANAVARG